MKRITYSKEKDEAVKKKHGISLRAIVLAIKKGKKVAIIAHPNNQKYRHQKIIIVEVNGYVYAVPSVEDEEKVFLKTAFPSRKYMKMFFKERRDRHEKEKV